MATDISKTAGLRGIGVFIAALWVAFLLDRVLPLEQLGLVPRSIQGLTGIVAMPFLHGDLGHIVANTVPLAILLALVTLSAGRTVAKVVAIAVLGGALLWLFGRNANHIGASGLVFGLAAYLVATGWYRRTLPSLLIAAVTVFLYGGVLWSGVLPTRSGVSWDGHLFGAVAGVAVAALSMKSSGRGQSAG